MLGMDWLSFGSTANADVKQLWIVPGSIFSLLGTQSTTFNTHDKARHKRSIPKLGSRSTLALGWHRSFLQTREQGTAWLRGRLKQQDPCDPATRLRPTRWRVLTSQDPHLHASADLKSCQNHPLGKEKSHKELSPVLVRNNYWDTYSQLLPFPLFCWLNFGNPLFTKPNC